MKRFRSTKLPSPASIIAVIALIAACTGSAFAAAKIGSGDIKDDAVKSKHISDDAVGSGEVENGSIKEKDIDKDTVDEFLAGGGTLGAPGTPGTNGTNGTNGVNGTNGTNGVDGADATYVGANWTQNLRNTDPGADTYLGAGPAVAKFPSGDLSAPPYGDGSLILNNDASEASHFSNEVDFFGDDVADLDEVGYTVFTTGENATRGEPMPNIKIEIDANLNTSVSSPDFTTLVYVPANNSVVNEWGSPIDAAGEDGAWFLTGGEGTALACATPGADCSLTDVKDKLAADNNGTPAKIRTVGVGKGRDTGFVGAVDGLQINDTIYDFEPFGVEEEPAS